MNDNIYVSIIIPVYNQEEYLDKCIKSVINQTYSFFECILVDDGSTDNSPTMCDEYSKTDSRIKVIHKKNGGLTSARHAGFNDSSCEYVCFLDSDDYLHPDFLKLTIKEMLQQDADVCTCGHFQDADGNIIEDTFNYPVYKIEKDDILTEYVLPIIGKIYADGYLNYPGYVWGRIYRKSCISSECFVSEREVYTEDDLFQMYLSKSIDKAIFISDKLVYYRVNQNSLTHAYRNNMWSMLKKRHEYVIDFFKNIQLPDVEDRLLASAFYAMYITLRNAYEIPQYSEFKKEISGMLTDSLPEIVFSKFNKALLRPRQKIMFFLLKRKWYLILYHSKRMLFG